MGVSLLVLYILWLGLKTNVLLLRSFCTRGYVVECCWEREGMCPHRYVVGYSLSSPSTNLISSHQINMTDVVSPGSLGDHFRFKKLSDGSLDKTKVICNLCSAQLSYCRSITSLKYHAGCTLEELGPEYKSYTNILI